MRSSSCMGSRRPTWVFCAHTQTAQRVDHISSGLWLLLRAGPDSSSPRRIGGKWRRWRFIWSRISRCSNQTKTMTLYLHNAAPSLLNSSDSFYQVSLSVRNRQSEDARFVDDDLPALLVGALVVAVSTPGTSRLLLGAERPPLSTSKASIVQLVSIYSVGSRGVGGGHTPQAEERCCQQRPRGSESGRGLLASTCQDGIARQENVMRHTLKLRVDTPRILI